MRSQPFCLAADQLKEDVCMINSVLKNMLGNYKLFTLEQEEELGQWS